MCVSDHVQWGRVQLTYSLSRTWVLSRQAAAKRVIWRLLIALAQGPGPLPKKKNWIGLCSTQSGTRRVPSTSSFPCQSSNDCTKLIHRLCWERTVGISSWYSSDLPKIFPDSTSDYSATARFRIVFQFLIHKMTRRRSLPSRGLKAWVWDRWLAGIAGSNPAGGTDVCLLWVLSGRGLCVGLITRPE